MKYLSWLILPGIFALFLTCQRNLWQSHGPLEISENGHYIQHTDGTPFLWIGDTGWAMFQRLTREEVDQYLDNRQAQGFTVIQSVAFWFPHGGDKPLGPHNEVNAYGHHPFAGDSDNPDTSEPLTIEGGSSDAPNDYWDHADYVIQAVKTRGMYLALLPCWGNAFINNRMTGSKIEFTIDEARAYGNFLGKKYQHEPHLIWVMGGDVDPVNFGDQDQRGVYRAMAEGIGRGVSGNSSLKWNTAHQDWDKTFMTFHAVQVPFLGGDYPGGSSSIWFHREAWLDVNMMETFKWTEQIYPLVTQDYELTNPVKPTILGEGAYEAGTYGHDCGWLTPLKVRRQAYHAFFAGAAGHTYGHWAIWPFRGKKCGLNWEQGLNAPGAEDVAATLKRLLISRGIFEFTPDQSLFLSNPGEGETRQCAMIDTTQKRILVYFPEIKAAFLHVNRINPGNTSTLVYMNPENGNYTAPERVTGVLTPPMEWQDAVAVIQSNQ